MVTITMQKLIVKQIPKKPSKRKEKQFADKFVYLLTSPCLYMPMWEPHKEMLDKRRIYLLAEPDCYDKKESTDYDALIYVQTASMNFPLDTEWYNIFMWLFMRYYGDITPPEWKEEHKKELDICEKQSLIRLKQWIFKKQIEDIKTKEKKNKKVEEKKQSTFDMFISR